MLHRSTSGAMAPFYSGAPLLPRREPGGVRRAGRVLPASGPTLRAALVAEAREMARFGRHLGTGLAALGRTVARDGVMLGTAILFAGGFTLGLPALFDLVSK